MMTDTRKYPAHSTPPPIATNSEKRQSAHDISAVLKTIAVFCLLLVIFGCPLAIVLEYRRSTADTTADKAPLGSVAGAQMGVHDARVSELSITSTHVDTSTPAPTRTPYPTFSPTIAHSTTVENSIDFQYISDNTDNEPIIQYVLQTQLVEVVQYVTVVVTSTPEPKTPQPTRDATQTQEAFVTGIENSAAKRGKVYRWIGLAWVIAGSGALIVLGAVSTYRSMKDEVVSLDDTTQTTEEIADKVGGDIEKLLDESIEAHGYQSHKLVGWRTMADLDEWTAERWTNTIDRMRSIGIHIFTKPGDGTYLTRNTIGDTYNHPPPPPTYPNK